MATITFNTALSFNAFSSGTFDPTSLITDPTVTVVTNTATEYRIQKNVDVPGFGNVPVQLVLRPATGSSFTPSVPPALPAGVVDSVAILVQVPVVGLTQVASITALASLGLTASQITSGGLLFSGADTFNGSNNGDLFSNGNDLFNTGGGSDTLNGNSGNDTLLAGGGFDTLNGGAGDDVLSGDGVGAATGDTPAGNDWINGGAGRDALYGGGEGDRFIFSTATDSAYGYDAGAQRFNGDVIYDYDQALDIIDLQGVAGRIIISRLGTNSIIDLDSDSDGLGEAGEGQIIVFNSNIGATDLLIGSRSLTYYGGAGGDFIRGSESATADILAGYGGGDIIVGGGGGDVIYAGAGDGAADTVRFGAASDSSYSLADVTGASADKVYDFVSGQDKLDFSFIAGQKTALIQTLAGNSYVYVDIGNNGSYDMTVLVVGATVVQGDLILQGAPADDEAQAAPALPLLLQYGGAWGQDLVSDNGFGYWKPEVMQLLPDDAFGHWVLGN